MGDRVRDPRCRVDPRRRRRTREWPERISSRNGASGHRCAAPTSPAPLSSAATSPTDRTFFSPADPLNPAQPIVFPGPPRRTRWSQVTAEIGVDAPACSVSPSALRIRAAAREPRSSSKRCVHQSNSIAVDSMMANRIGPVLSGDVGGPRRGRPGPSPCRSTRWIDAARPSDPGELSGEVGEMSPNRFSVTTTSKSPARGAPAGLPSHQRAVRRRRRRDSRAPHRNRLRAWNNPGRHGQDVGLVDDGDVFATTTGLLKRDFGDPPDAARVMRPTASATSWVGMNSPEPSAMLRSA